MIIFDLACADEHRFEGWFRSAEDFAEQQARGLVCCPHCASADVRRVPSAVHVGKASPGEADLISSSGKATASSISPLAMLRTLVERALENSEDVGSAFPEEARRIYYHEAPARAIHGQASDEEYEALREEGIDVLRFRLPKPGRLN